MALAISSANAAPAYSYSNYSNAGAALGDSTLADDTSALGSATDSTADSTTTTPATSATPATATAPLAAGAASADGSDDSLSALDTAQQALLEAQIAVYQQALQQAQSGDSDGLGGVSAQQLEQRIAALQQQLDKLGTSASGTLIDTFA